MMNENFLTHVINRSVLLHGTSSEKWNFRNKFSRYFLVRINRQIQSYRVLKKRMFASQREKLIHAAKLELVSCVELINL